MPPGRNAIQARVRDLRYGFLATPAGLLLAFMGLAFALLAIDRASGSHGLGVGVGEDPSAARAVLTAIAGSVATVAGVTFSITIVTLQLVSQQFTPRALRRFLGDRITQVVAGVYVGVFVYCLLVLRTVESRSADGQPFVPTLSVTVALVLAVAALGLLLVFIDHIARSIQVSSIASDIARSCMTALDRVYPEPFGRAIPADGSALLDAWSREAECRHVHPARAGYVQAVELDDLEDLRGLRVHVTVRPGDFVSEADAVARFWTADAPDEVTAALRRVVVIANERDVDQDPGYGVRQLVDIAVRALSPGVNDPTTAWTCIAYVRAIMQRLAGREFPDPVRRLGDTTVVIAEQRTFEEYVDAAYVQIARYAQDPRVSGALLESLLSATRAAMAAGAAERERILTSTAGVIADGALTRDTDVAGREQIERLLGQIGTVAAGQPQADDALPAGRLAR